MKIWVKQMIIKSKLEIKNTNSDYPLQFTKDVVEENRYYYVVIPHELVKRYSLQHEDLIDCKIKNYKFIARLRKSSNSLMFTIPKQIAQDVRKIELIEITEKLDLQKVKENGIITKAIDGKLFIDLYKSFPTITSRDNLQWKFKLSSNTILAVVTPKHVNGKELKYITLPRYVDLDDLSLFFGLMFSDGLKKFGFGEWYGNSLKKPIPSLQFTNGDPYVIKLFLDLITALFNLQYSDFKADLIVPKNLTYNESELRWFWKTRIGLELNNFFVHKKTRVRWCYAGILNIRKHNFALSEFIISMLKKMLIWLQSNKAPDIARKNFLIGAFIGDGSPVLDKQRLRRFMVSIETNDEAKIYLKILKKLNIEAKSLWKEEYNYTKPYLRKVDICAPQKDLVKIAKFFPFGFYKNGQFYGSLEKHLKTLEGTPYSNSSDNEISEELHNLLKSDLRELYKNQVPLPEVYRKYLYGELKLPIQSRRLLKN